jgi:hypothetical protein
MRIECSNELSERMGGMLTRKQMQESAEGTVAMMKSQGCDEAEIVAFAERRIRETDEELARLMVEVNRLKVRSRGWHWTKLVANQ